MKKIIQLRTLNWYEWALLFLLVLFTSKYMIVGFFARDVIYPAHDFSFKNFFIYNFILNVVFDAFAFLIIGGICQLGSNLFRLPIKFVHWMKAIIVSALVYSIQRITLPFFMAFHENYSKEEMNHWNSFKLSDIFGVNTEHFWLKVFPGTITLYDIAFIILLVFLTAKFSSVPVKQIARIIGFIFIPVYLLYNIIFYSLITGLA